MIGGEENFIKNNQFYIGNCYSSKIITKSIIMVGDFTSDNLFMVNQRVKNELKKELKETQTRIMELIYK